MAYLDSRDRVESAAIQGFALSVAVLLVALLASSSLRAATTDAIQSPVVAVKEWMSIGTSRQFYNEGIVSSDLTLEVHLGPRAFEDGLFVRNLSTGEDSLLLRDAGGFKEFDSMSFSPDGTHIIFRACPPLGVDCGSAAIYTIAVDGTGLSEIAKSSYREETGEEYRLESPRYSPDGSEALVQIAAVTKTHVTNAFGSELPPSWQYYVGVLRISEANQPLQPLIEGKPLFWNSRGSGFHYLGKEGLALYDLKSGSMSLVSQLDGGCVVLGKVPGLDAAFVRDTAGRTIRVISLDGREIGRDVGLLASGIPLRDLKGRFLKSIEGDNMNAVSLHYSTNYPEAGAPPLHTEVVRLRRD